MWYSIILVTILFLSAPAFADTIHVPGDYPTIQAAIDAAVNGDIVFVAPGTYFENIDFLGKAITVQSEDGPESTIIDGRQLEKVVTFDSGEGIQSILKGFTVTNGTGGIKCGAATGPLIIHNIISENHTLHSGGGLYCYIAKPTIVYNTISWNESGKYGGGIYCQWCTAIIVGNIFYRNRAKAGYFSYGGGISSTDSTATIANNILYGNKAERGGAVHWGGYGAAVLTNNTITDNKAIYMGGGLFCINSPSTEVTNTIFWNNNAPEGHEICLGLGSGIGELAISYSDVQGGETDIQINSGSILLWGEGNIDLDPNFAAPTYSDFHLTYTSPCKDVGDNGVVPSINDFEGDPRITYGTVDMGADEFYTHLYFTGDKTPGGSIQGKFVGLPGTTPVGLFIGSDILASPIPTMWGDYWLQAPWFIFGPLGAIPSDGVMVLPTTLPGSIPAPYDIPMQALIGLNADSLTNLCVLEVR